MIFREKQVKNNWAWEQALFLSSDGSSFRDLHYISQPFCAWASSSKRIRTTAVTHLLHRVMNDSDSSHRPLQVLYTISDVSCSSSHQPESYRLLMGLSFKSDGQGKACGRTWPLKLYSLASLCPSCDWFAEGSTFLRREVRREGGDSLRWVCDCHCTGSCWNPDVRSRSIFWGTAHQLLPSCTRNKGLQIQTWKPTKIPEDCHGSHVHNLMPNLHAPLVYLNPSFPEDAVPSLIPSADGLHLPKWKPQFHPTQIFPTKLLDAAVTQAPALRSLWSECGDFLSQARYHFNHPSGCLDMSKLWSGVTVLPWIQSALLTT